MTNVTEYLEEAAHYIDEGSRSIVEALTDDQFEDLVQASKYFCGPEPGIDNALIKTHETLSDFDESRSASWNECGIRDEVDFGDCPGRAYESVQMVKGQTRSNFVVIDLGEYRVVVK